MSEASFTAQPPSPDDPVVCGACGLTLGKRLFLDTDEKLAVRAAEHEPECRRRIAHQRRHRILAGPCPACPGGARTAASHDVTGTLAEHRVFLPGMLESGPQ